MIPRLLLALSFATALAAQDPEIVRGKYLYFGIQQPAGGPKAGEPYVLTLFVAAVGARTAVFDWTLPREVEWVDERCVFTGGTVWRCTLTGMAFAEPAELRAHLVAPLSNQSQITRAELVSSDPPEDRQLAHLTTVYPRTPSELAVRFVTFDSTDADGHAELRIELESKIAPLDPAEIRLYVDLLFRMRILDMQLPEGWNCTTEEQGQILSCRVPAPATGQKATAVFKVHALQANQNVFARVSWIDSGFPIEDRRFAESFLVYVREQVVTNTNDSGPGSLRQAMLDASSGACRHYIIPCRIRFDIPPPPDGQWLTIRPETPLPPIPFIDVDNLTIDGTTQTNVRDTNPLGPEIALDGSLLDAGDGLSVHASRSIIRGLAIHSFPGSGIEVQSQARIEGNYIGTDPTGRVAMPNASRGVTTSGFSPEIVGNVISGNFRSGIFSMSGGATVRDNLIGVAADGVTPLGNGASGIFAGPGAGFGIVDNVIAHNRHFGIGIVRAPEVVLNRPSVVAVRNRIYDNAIAAIDHNLDGPGGSTPVPAPVLTSAVYDPVTDSTLIRGTFKRAQSSGVYQHTIHFYADDGTVYLGFLSTGEDEFTFRVKGNFAGRSVSAHMVRSWNWAELSETITTEFGNSVVVH